MSASDWAVISICAVAVIGVLTCWAKVRLVRRQLAAELAAIDAEIEAGRRVADLKQTEQDTTEGKPA